MGAFEKPPLRPIHRRAASVHPAAAMVASRLVALTLAASASGGSPAMLRSAFGARSLALRPLSLRGGRSAAPPTMSTAHEAPALEFYTNDMCPYAQRVWIVLEELGVPYNKTLIDLRDKPAWYVQSVNPRGKVPAIRDLSDGTVVVESLVANEYLVERFGEQHESSLMPSQAEPRARVRLWNAHLD